jgi:hypothetical protein
VTECESCKTRDIYRFGNELCCWLRFFRGLPGLPDGDGLTTQDFWLAKLRKAGKYPLANDIAKSLNEEAHG